MQKENENRTITENRKARHDYFIDEVFECGIELFWTQWVLVENISLLVGADVNSEGKKLASVYLAIGVLEIYSTFSD